MDMADLLDTDFNFECEFSGDGVDYWDYTLSAKYKDYEYHHSMSMMDVEYLRTNCKRILKATEGCVSEGY